MEDNGLICKQCSELVRFHKIPGLGKKIFLTWPLWKQS